MFIFTQKDYFGYEMCIFLLIFPFRLLEINFFILLNLFFLAKNWHFKGVNEKVLGSLILFPSNLFISIDYSFNCAKLGCVIQFSSFQVKLMNYQTQHCLQKSNQTILLTIKEGQFYWWDLLDELEWRYQWVTHDFFSGFDEQNHATCSAMQQVKLLV